MSNQENELVTQLIPIGEYKTSQFLFYDCRSNQLYAIDNYNSRYQNYWIWGGIVFVVPILKRLFNTFLLSSIAIKSISVILAIILAVIAGKVISRRILQSRSVYKVDSSQYQTDDFYAFADKTYRLVLEGFGFICLAILACLGLYLWGGDILFLGLFFLLMMLFIGFIEGNQLKRGWAIKQLKAASKSLK